MDEAGRPSLGRALARDFMAGIVLAALGIGNVAAQHDAPVIGRY